MSFIFLILAIVMLVAKQPVIAIVFALIALFTRRRRS